MRFPDKKHTCTHGSFTDIFWHSRMSFSIRRLTYIYSLLIEKDICDCRNVLVNLPCVHVCLSSGDLFIFLVRVSSFFFYFCVICTSLLPLSMWSMSVCEARLSGGETNTIIRLFLSKTPREIPGLMSPFDKWIHINSTYAFTKK